MKQDEIIEMAKQAGMGFNQPLAEFSTPLCDGVEIEELEAFAKLVAAKEREACEKRAEIALLGTLKTTSDRVLRAIRARGEA